MTNPALQLNQLFADPLLAQSLKGGNALLGNLGTPNAKNAQAFGGLLSGLMAMRKNPLLEMTPAVDASTSDLTQADLLKGLPADLLALINANAAAQKNDDITDGILNALSTSHNAAKGKNLFALVDDPELASALAGLAAKLQSLQTGVESTLLQTTLNAANAGLTPNMSSDMAKLHDFAKRMQNDGTLTIADMDLDTFQAFKKLAFADIAPYLTQPRNVVVDGKSVMKVAGGPSFLNEGNTDLTTLATDISLQSILDQTPIAPNNTGMDTLLLAQVTTLSTAQQNAGTSPLPTLTPDALNADASGKTAPALTATPQTTISGSSQNNAQGGQLGANNNAANFAAPSTSESRGFSDVPFADLLGDAATAAGDGAEFLNLKPTADSTSPQSAASTLMHSARAGQLHPGSHLVSLTVQRNLTPSTSGTERNLIINMEPESLGRIQVTLQFGDNKALKVHLVAERPEALALMQKDLGALERTLADAGLDTSAEDSFTFDLASDESFSESTPQDSGDNAQNSASKQSDDEFGTPLANIETVMPIFVDPNTGLTHVNIVV